jgi:acetyl esterase/lipase
MKLEDELVSGAAVARPWPYNRDASLTPLQGATMHSRSIPVSTSLRLAPAAAALFTLGAVLTLPAPARAGAIAGRTYSVQPVRDIAYYDGAGADATHHKLDLFLPKGEKDFPVVLFVHGGAWQRGDKTFLGVYQALGTFLARHGIATAVINYRLSPAVKHPEHIRDVARAFAWTYKNIASYGGRPDRLFVCGHSSGGHLVALLATDPEWLKAEGLKPDSIRGVIPISGVYDLSELPDWLLTRTFGDAGDVLAGASPTRQARAGLPPFLILYADHDLPGCDRKPAEAFAKALRDKGTKVEAREVANSNHYTIFLSAVVLGDTVCETILNFITTNATTP